MPFTTKQKAKEKHSRQSDVMSDLENMDVMIGIFPRNDYKNHPDGREIEVNSQSDEPHENVHPMGKMISVFVW